MKEFCKFTMESPAASYMPLPRFLFQDETLRDITNDAKVLYAQNVYETMHPASLTKIMTALVALKYGSMDQVLTASDNVRISESGAQLCGIKPGDSMTLSQALHILLIYSANDVGALIAEGVAGDVAA